MIYIFTYSVCHICLKLTVMFVTTFDAVIFFCPHSYWKKLSTTLNSINRVFFQYIHFQIIESTFRENFSYTYFFKKGRFFDVTYYGHIEGVRFYSLDFILFLRVVFTICVSAIFYQIFIFHQMIAL